MPFMGAAASGQSLGRDAAIQETIRWPDRGTEFPFGILFTATQLEPFRRPEHPVIRNVQAESLSLSSIE